MEYLMDRYLDEWNEFTLELAIERGYEKEKEIKKSQPKLSHSADDSELPF